MTAQRCNKCGEIRDGHKPPLCSRKGCPGRPEEIPETSPTPPDAKADKNGYPRTLDDVFDFARYVRPKGKGLVTDAEISAWGNGVRGTAEAVGEFLDEQRHKIPRWQTIDSAPRNGTDVLGYSPDAPPPGIFKVAFFAFEGDPDPGEWYITDRESGLPIDVELTHWQPLPAPPVEGA